MKILIKMLFILLNYIAKRSKNILRFYDYIHSYTIFQSNELIPSFGAGVGSGSSPQKIKYVRVDNGFLVMPGGNSGN